MKAIEKKFLKGQNNSGEPSNSFSIMISTINVIDLSAIKLKSF